MNDNELIERARAELTELHRYPEHGQVVPLGESPNMMQGASWLEELGEGRWQACHIDERAQTEEVRRGAVVSPTLAALNSWVWSAQAARSRKEFPNLVSVARDHHPDFVQPESSEWTPQQWATIFAQAIEVLNISVPYLILDGADEIPAGFEGFVVQKWNERCEFTITKVTADSRELLYRMEMEGGSDRVGRGAALKMLLNYLTDRPGLA